MSLLDVLNGMQQGPRGPATPPQQQGGSSGGMSPLTLAVLGLLAWKAYKHWSAGQSGAPDPGAPDPGAPTPQGAPGPGTAGTNPGDILKNGLGGLLAGGAAGNVLAGGLSDLIKRLHDNGHGEAANSWVSGDPNKSIGPSDLSKALGADQINELSRQSGLPPDDLVHGLSHFLPNAIDHLTPDGRLPTEDELSGRL